MKNRIEYRRGDLLEWYVNDEHGLEQGFTLMARLSEVGTACYAVRDAFSGATVEPCVVDLSEAVPPATTRAGTSQRDVPTLNGGELRFDLAFETELKASLGADGQSVRFADEQGAAQFSFSKLTVIDANGRTISARMEIQAEEPELAAKER